MAGRTLFSFLCMAIGFMMVIAGLVQSTRVQPETSQPPPQTNLTTAALADFETWRPPAVVHTSPVATPVTEPPVIVNTSPVSRIQAPSIDVDAAVVLLGLEPDGVMETPPDPVSVGWYNFSAHPAAKGNVVMAAHVDWANYGPAVFWELRNLKPGDRVSLTLADGSSYTYEVATLDYYDLETAPVQQIVGPTPGETLTLITCGGSFDHNVHEYDQRLVVRAHRVQV